MAQAAELRPPTFAVDDTAGIRDHIREQGYVRLPQSPPSQSTLGPHPTLGPAPPTTARRAALWQAVVRDAATSSELEEARALLWRHLGETHGWRQDDPKTWTDAAYEAPAVARGEGGHGHGLGGNPRSGLLGSTVHSDCFWYCRTLPGVLTAFAAACKRSRSLCAFFVKKQRGSLNATLLLLHRRHGRPRDRIRSDGDKPAADRRPAQPQQHGHGAGRGCGPPLGR